MSKYKNTTEIRTKNKQIQRHIKIYYKQHFNLNDFSLNYLVLIK